MHVGFGKLRPAWDLALDSMPMDNAFFVYILASKRNGTLYGAPPTTSRGVWQSTKGKLVPGFTRQHSVDLLVYFEAFDSVLEAREREHSLKRWRRA
jgi:putative endonuclease